MPENLYPKLPSAPSISQESFNVETIRKYYQDITDLKNKYHEEQWKYSTANPSKLVLRKKTCFKKIFLILRKIILSLLQAK